MEKKIDRIHLVYCVIIGLILIVAIILFWILSSQHVISEYVFDNFAFAATIVSIVLAVVSIIYTIHSGTGITDSISVLKNVQDNISEQIETLQGVEKTIKDSISDEQKKIEASLDCMLKSQFEQFFVLPSGDFPRVEKFQDVDARSVMDIHNNPPLGNIFLYCCLLSKLTSKPWNLDMPQDIASLYFCGYIAALKAIPSIGFTYHLDKDNNMLSQCDFSKSITDTITIEALQEVLKEQSKEYPMFKDVILRINKFFKTE